MPGGFKRSPGYGQVRIAADLWQAVGHLAVDLDLSREGAVEILLREALDARQRNGVHV